MPLSAQSPHREVAEGASPRRDPARDKPLKHPGLPWKRIFGSFFLVLGIYAAYSITVVPLIEPPAAPVPEYRGSDIEGKPGYGVVDQQRAALAPWFSADSWERNHSKVIDSPTTKVVIKKYEALKDGRLSISPCTLILLSNSPTATPEERNRKAVILQAPEAILSFESPVDMVSMKLSKLTGGVLRGPIKIRSDQNLPGPEDDLVVNIPGDAELIGDRITAPHPVDFRLGQNHGNGNGLEIVLAPATTPQPNSPAPGFSGVNSLTLKRDVRMRLHPGNADLFAGAAAGSQKPKPASAMLAPPSAAARPGDNAPVDITCAGAFQFDMLRYAAVFHDRVDVLRINSDADSDQLTSDVLSIFFEPVTPNSPGTAPPPAGRQNFPKLEPSRIEADGNPVVIRSPSRGVQARGTRLEYDIKRNAGSLRGPGWMQGARPGDARVRPIEARWTTLLEFGPFENAQMAKLVGDAHVESVGVGELNGGTIVLFLVEHPAPTPEKPDGRRLVPDRLQAYRRVSFGSPQLSGEVEHLQVWLLQPRPTVPGAAGNAPAGPTLGGSASRGPAPINAADPTEPPRQHLHLIGQLLQVEAVMPERGGAEVTRVHIEAKPEGENDTRTATGNSDTVELRETQVAEPGARPLLVRGERIDVEQPLPNQSIVHIHGRLAHIEARELSIDGAAIHLDRGRNVARVDGQGLLVLRTSTGLSGEALAQPRPLDITWKGRMEFDGREAKFFDGVKAQMKQQRVSPKGLPVVEDQKLTGELLVAEFNPPISFSDVRPGTRPQIERVTCSENVFVEQLTFEAGRQTSLERMQLEELSAEQTTGHLKGRGPGWVRRVWIDNGEGMNSLPGAPRTKPKTVEEVVTEPKREQLVYLGINFQGGLAGNQRYSTVEFDDRVRCIYGPVPDWDTMIEPDDPDKLGVGGALLTSDRLQVAREPGVGGASPTFTLTATGNAKLDGQAAAERPRDAGTRPSATTGGVIYSATGAILQYVDAKKKLTIEGDGDNPATLSRQARIGGARSVESMRKLTFYPQTNRIDADDGTAGTIEGIDLPAPRPRPPTGPAAQSSAPATRNR